MRIDWREGISQAELLPGRHPARGILEERDGFLRRELYRFSPPPVPASLPAPAGKDVVAALTDWHREAGAPPETFDSLRLLGDGAAAVVTGQQAGLLGGPLLTVVKALSAVAVARGLSARTGRPFVPVFWAETDDHDWQEANRAVTLTPSGEVQAFSLPWPPERQEHPTGSLPLGAEAEKVVESFLEASGRTDFSSALRERMLADLEGSGTFGRWFSRQLLALLGRHGLVVLDSLDSRWAHCAKDLWVRVLDDPLALTEMLQRRGDELMAAGYKPVLSKKKKRAPFFLMEGGKRSAVFYERGSFRSSEGAYTPLELRRRLEGSPGDFSAAVNLRPLLQDTLLPTAVYVGGPTELGYFQQVLPGYDWAGIAAPDLLLRAGITFVEPAVRRLLDKRGIEPAALRRGIDGVLSGAVRRGSRLADEGRWEKAREATLRPLERLAASLDESDGDTRRQIDKTRGKIDFLVRELEKKTVGIIRKRSDELKGQLERAATRLYPGGSLQERTLSPWYFLNKYGLAFFDELLTGLPSDFTTHWFGTILPGGADPSPGRER